MAGQSSPENWIENLKFTQQLRQNIALVDKPGLEAFQMIITLPKLISLYVNNIV
jgi:hypothetical protein